MEQNRYLTHWQWPFWSGFQCDQSDFNWKLILSFFIANTFRPNVRVKIHIRNSTCLRHIFQPFFFLSCFLILQKAIDSNLTWKWCRKKINGEKKESRTKAIQIKWKLKLTKPANALQIKPKKIRCQFKRCVLGVWQHSNRVESRFTLFRSVMLNLYFNLNAMHFISF